MQKPFVQAGRRKTSKWSLRHGLSYSARKSTVVLYVQAGRHTSSKWSRCRSLRSQLFAHYLTNGHTAPLRFALKVTRYFLRYNGGQFYYFTVRVYFAWACHYFRTYYNGVIQCGKAGPFIPLLFSRTSGGILWGLFLAKPSPSRCWCFQCLRKFGDDFSKVRQALSQVRASLFGCFPANALDFQS